jgi:hypothetical protein
LCLLIERFIGLFIIEHIVTIPQHGDLQTIRIHYGQCAAWS